ncbi:MAG: outer membrane protein assembly factor BamE [Alphaproteobacteria bacterium]|nr:outer membrane protein assembly factor BamE [Alphaproteobacteria bacterium]
MSIRKIFFLSMVLVCTSCSSDLFLKHNGNMPEENKVARVAIGQSKTDVQEILGNPSSVTGLSDDHWIYMSSTQKKVAFLHPEELDREILALTFDNGKVSKIEKFDLQDGNKIKIDEDETQTANPNIGFFRKYFGGVGQYLPFGNGKSDRDI